MNARRTPVRALVWLLAWLLPLCLPSDGAPEPPAPPPATDQAVTAPELDRAIGEVMQRSEFAWRLPKEEAATPERGPTALAAFWNDLADTLRKGVKGCLRILERISRWLEKWLRSDDEADRPADLGWQDSVRLLLFVLLAATCSLLAIVLMRLWQRRRQRVTEATAAPAAAADLLNDAAAADQLPPDEWMAMAGDLLARGEYRLAIRAMFLGSLARFAATGVLTLARHKSNRDYCRELDRKARDRADVRAAFAINVRTLERVWYGRHPASGELAAEFARNCETAQGGLDLQRREPHAN